MFLNAEYKTRTRRRRNFFVSVAKPCLLALSLIGMTGCNTQLLSMLMPAATVIDDEPRYVRIGNAPPPPVSHWDNPDTNKAPDAHSHSKQQPLGHPGHQGAIPHNIKAKPKTETVHSMQAPETMFASKPKDINERIRRIESAVISLRHDVNTMIPLVSKFMALENDMMLLRKGVATAPPMTTAKQHKAEPKAVKPIYPKKEPYYRPDDLFGDKPAAKPKRAAQAKKAAPMPPKLKDPSIIGVHHIRLGAHKDKTRIVMDVNGPATYNYDLDAVENILIIELPQSKWMTHKSGTAKKSGLIKSFAVEDMGEGSMVIIQLAKNAKVKQDMLLKPSNVSAYNRVVFDLVKN